MSNFSHPDHRGSKNPGWKGGVSIGENKRAYYNALQNKKLREIRNAALEGLGGKCVKCGFSDKRALQVDHIDGNGCKERREKKFNGYAYKAILESFLRGENRYQLLCANCNWIKRVENNELKTDA